MLGDYAATALAAGWIIVAADPGEDVTLEQDDVPLRLALVKAALATLALQWPGADKCAAGLRRLFGRRQVFGLARRRLCGRGAQTIIGIYLAGINQDTLVAAAEQFKVLDAKFKNVPVFLQSGEKDEVATPADHRAIFADLRRAGFRRVQVEYFPGAHEVEPAPLRTALDCFPVDGDASLARAVVRRSRARRANIAGH